MSARGEDPAARIMRAAVDIIERDGVEAATVREIAREAGVNVAALNYYFRTKDALVTQVLMDRLDHVADDAIRLLRDEGESAERRVRSVLEYLLGGALAWPRLIQAIILSSRSDEGVGSRAREGLGRIVAELGRVLDPAGGRSAMARAVGLFSAVTLPALMPGVFEAAPGIKLSTPRQRSDYVRSLLGASFE
jgi:TetR/AcrR family transcriptional regulator, regulator of cefoperazone and chloramphenicol sensitivity